VNPPPDPSTANVGFTHTALYPGVGSGSGSPPTYPGYAAAPPPLLGRVAFGKYEVVRELGEGGMGRVFEAVDRELGRAVAIKVLKTTDPFEASRFRGEAELIARLDHPNIVKIYDIQTTPDGQPYLVLEFAEGGSLDRELQGQPQVPRRAAETVETLARALQYAFDGQKVIHRDLKPANVLRGKDGVLKVTDFGLAKQLEVSSARTPSGAVLGTPSYMAPEQADGKGKEFGPTVDVYGLGAILYELLTGRPPFRGVNLVETLEQVRWADPAPPSRLVPRLPRDLSTICLKCLSKAPGRRYASAAELAADLRRWLNGETIVARPAPAWERAWRNARRRPWQAATAAATGLAALLLVGGGLVVWRQQELRAADRQLGEQQREADDRLKKQQDAAADRLQKRGEQSLKALNGIRGLILDGELSQVRGLEPLNRALFDYYQNLIAEQQREGGYKLAELADSSVKMGDLIHRTGDKRLARDAYRQAADLYGQLPPESHRPDRAAVSLKIGRVSYELGDDAAAEVTCAEARERWDQLRAGEGKAEATARAAEARHLWGEILFRRRDLPASIRAFEDSIRLRREVAGDDPTKSAADLEGLPPDERRKALQRLQELARGYGYLGDVLLDSRRIPEADRAYWDSHRLRQKVEETLARVAANPVDNKTRGELFQAQFQLARSWGNFAAFQVRGRALETAKQSTENALKLRKALTAARPDNVEYKLDLCATLNRIADLTLRLGDPAAPGEWEAAAVPLAAADAEVPRDDPSGPGGRSVSAREILAESHTLVAQLLADTKPDRSRAELTRALALLDDLCREHPKYPRFPFLKAAALALRAELGGGAPDDRPQALAALDAAVRTGYRETHPEDVRRLRAFRSIRDDERFVKLVRQIDPD
jgi:hypothetical protein